MSSENQPMTPASAPPALSTTTPVVRQKRNLVGLMHVVKGRSYIEPINGRPPPLALRQGINGLVGKKTVFYGDIEGLKNKNGFLIANPKDIILSQRFVRVCTGPDWKHLTGENKIPQSSDNIGKAKIPGKHIDWSYSNLRLYPGKTYLMNRRKQGQCYSLMMEAKCQEQLFKAELSRARRIGFATAFIRKQEQSRLTKKQMKFEGYESRDEVLVAAVKAYIKEAKTRSLQPTTTVMFDEQERMSNQISKNVPHVLTTQPSLQR